MKNTIWLRDEYRITERRTPLLPDGAEALIDNGYNVVVEKSRKRIINDEAYKRAGCHIMDSGTWRNAADNAIILGLKELPKTPPFLTNTHIYFAHAFKEQTGWQDILSRFEAGGGNLLDIEYMVQNNKRVVAFGYWAGYMGAALALIHWNNKQSGNSRYLDKCLIPFNKASLLNDTIKNTAFTDKKPRVLIIGAHGRSGQGALKILEDHSAHVTLWGREQTEQIDRIALLDHDILINCAFIKGKVPAFLRRQDLTEKTRLTVVADVSCDPFSSFNPIPLYHNTTSWDKAYLTVKGITGGKTIDIIAIDNLPSLLPREASEEFATQLLPHLLTLDQRESNPVWFNARNSYDNAVSLMTYGQQELYKAHVA